jgi:single-strand DNA-binding protein
MPARTWILGTVGADPEVRYTNGGTAVASLRVASDERRKVDGEWKKATDWYTVKLFGKPAERAGQILHKGSAVLVPDCERLEREYNGKTYADYIARDFFLAGKGGGQQQQQRQQELPDDDVPF